jgi:hypothetical protein
VAPPLGGRSSGVCRKFNLELCNDQGWCRFKQNCRKGGHKSANCSDGKEDGAPAQVSTRATHGGYIWEYSTKSSFLCPSATASESAAPLPSPPASILNHPDIVSTLAHHSYLFCVVASINPDRFQALLSEHPDSVVRGLRERFWPPADQDPLLYPTTPDFP